MKNYLIWILLPILLMAGCAEAGETKQEVQYAMITAQEARQLMQTEQNYIVLDVRTEEEYEQGHILGAIVLSYDEVEEKADKVLPDKDQLILVYCRSGRRSKIAAETLVKMGYTNVKEFGGIQDWPYEIEGIDETEG